MAPGAAQRARIAARAATAAATAATVRRDRAIVAAIRAGISYRELSATTGLPLATLHRIVARG